MRGSKVRYFDNYSKLLLGQSSKCLGQPLEEEVYQPIFLEDLLISLKNHHTRMI